MHLMKFRKAKWPSVWFCSWVREILSTNTDWEENRLRAALDLDVLIN